MRKAGGQRSDLGHVQDTHIGQRSSLQTPETWPVQRVQQILFHRVTLGARKLDRQTSSILRTSGRRARLHAALHITSCGKWVSYWCQ